MSFNNTIRTLAWVSFWILLFLVVTSNWSGLMQDWHTYQGHETRFPSPHSDWG